MHYITISGKDLVKTYISKEEEDKIKQGKRTKSSKVKGYPVCYDGIFYFKEGKDVKKGGV